MIQVSNISKSFDSFKVLNSLTLTVKKGSIYGLVGANGSGKTTIIKHITGILKQDEGQITIEGENVFDNIRLKQKMGFIPDDLYFFAGFNLTEMSKFYKELYPCWNGERFNRMSSQFELDSKRKLAKFSKGTQKQAAFMLTMSVMPEYLILDEPIDGLDPLIRKIVWQYIIDDVTDREMSVLVSSHNLRELEGICDSIGILSEGTMMIERDLDVFNSNIHKVQVAYKENSKPENPYTGLNILHSEKRGSVDLLIIRNRKDFIESMLNNDHPVFMITHLFVPIITGVLVFRYIQTTASVTSLHAMPFTRAKLFNSNVLSGLLIITIPRYFRNTIEWLRENGYAGQIEITPDMVSKIDVWKKSSKDRIEITDKGQIAIILDTAETQIYTGERYSIEIIFEQKSSSIRQYYFSDETAPAFIKELFQGNAD